MACAAVVAAGMAGCSKGGKGIDFMATLPEQNAASPAALKQEAEALGVLYDKRPGEKNISLRYAAALRQSGQHGQAVAVLQRASIANLNDADVSAAYGKILADVGRLQEAAEVLARAHTPDRPNWRVLSAQGAVADQLGDHERAQQFYQNALQVAPGEPAVLSNLGLSYALTRRLPEAEKVLSEAAANPRADSRVRANLSLVLALQGKFQESEAMARRDLPPKDAEANVQEIRRIIAQNNSWQEIQKSELTRKKKASGQ
jgi:Flp pilus assembly protein TadD